MQREKWSFLFTQIPLCLKAINRKLYVLPYTVNYDWKENVIAIESQKFSTLQKYPCEITIHSRPVVFGSNVYKIKKIITKKIKDQLCIITTIFHHLNLFYPNPLLYFIVIDS